MSFISKVSYAATNPSLYIVKENVEKSYALFLEQVQIVNLDEQDIQASFCSMCSLSDQNKSFPNKFFSESTRDFSKITPLIAHLRKSKYVLEEIQQGEQPSIYFTSRDIEVASDLQDCLYTMFKATPSRALFCLDFEEKQGSISGQFNIGDFFYESNYFYSKNSYALQVQLPPLLVTEIQQLITAPDSETLSNDAKVYKAVLEVVSKCQLTAMSQHERKIRLRDFAQQCPNNVYKVEKSLYMISKPSFFLMPLAQNEG